MITEVLNSIDAEGLQSFVSSAAQHSIVDWTVKIGIVWVLMGRKVNQRFTEFQASLSVHFSEVEKGFANMVGEMKALKENISSEMGSHAQRIDGLATEVVEIKTRVTKLETPRGH